MLQSKLSFFAAKRKNVSVGVESGKSVKRLHKCKKIPQTIDMARGLCYDSIQKEHPVPGGELSPDGSVSICLTHILPTECLAAGVLFLQDTETEPAHLRRLLFVCCCYL